MLDPQKGKLHPRPTASTPYYRLALIALCAAVLAGCASPRPGAIQHGSKVPALIAGAAPAVVNISNQSTSIGTGFFVRPCTLATNHHIAAQSPLFTRTTDGQASRLTTLTSDSTADLALLKIESCTQPSAMLPLAEGEPILGDPVLVLGNPFGLGLAATTGIVSALPRAIGKAERLQIDAAINPGNSGGPVLNHQGEVLGVVVSRGAVGSGIGFAAPVEALLKLLRELPENR